MQAHTNPREKTRDLWKNPCHDSSDTQYIQANSWLIQQDSVSTGYTASRHHDWGCLWACKNPCPAVVKQRWASTSLQMRDEFQGCNRHNVQKGIISHVSYFVYNIVSVGSGTCKQTFLPYAQNINCPRPRDIWYTFTLVDTTVFWNKNAKQTIKKVEQLIKRSQMNDQKSQIKRMQTKGMVIIGDQFRVDFT